MGDILINQTVEFRIHQPSGSSIFLIFKVFDVFVFVFVFCLFDRFTVLLMARKRVLLST